MSKKFLLILLLKKPKTRDNIKINPEYLMNLENITFFGYGLWL